MIDAFADQGHPAFTAHREEGHVQAWRRASEYVDSRLQTWLDRVNRSTS
jgi:hypothetical protein